MSFDANRRPSRLSAQLSVNGNIGEPRRPPQHSPVARHGGSFPRHHQQQQIAMDRARIDNIEKKLDAVISLLTSSGKVIPVTREPVDNNIIEQGGGEIDAESVYQEQPSDEHYGPYDDDSDDSDEYEEQLYPLDSSRTKQSRPDDEERVINPDEAWMINPKNTFRMSWDLGVIMPLLVYLTLVMPFRLCFENEAPKFTVMYWIEFAIDMLFIMDIFLNFRTGYVIDVDKESNASHGPPPEIKENEDIEYDRVLVAWAYMKSWFLLDVISGVPFALLELVLSSGGSTGDLKSAKALKLLRFLKLGRLLKMDKILSNLDRDTLDVIEDFFQNGSTRSAVVMMRLVFYMAYVCHLMACGFVLVGRIGNKEGLDCWFDHEGVNGHGPYHAADTTGGELVFSIYISAFYFCLTTMTSVGYGDIISHNNTERIYIILLEFIGAIIFATIIAAITSVVTSMDMNARKTAEQLDAVASFVAVRQFPEHMAKRIRRHFRHFYSLKSAIDETKIFSELSSSLRKEVSDYLIHVLMGHSSIFTTMSPTLWPRLLPLLRPMTFEPNEKVCLQGEECTEMYVVLVGSLRGVTKALADDKDPDPFLPRSRKIATGKSVNVLHVLGLWHECIETVTAEVVVESYAVSEFDFFDLFASNADKDCFEKMQNRELMNFKVIPYDNAPNEFHLKPLFYSCFSILEVATLQLRQPELNIHSSDKYDHKRSSHAHLSLIIDVVDLTDTEPNSWWKHRINKIDLAKRQIPDKGGPHHGRPIIQVSEIDIADEVKWTDISDKFEHCALRIRLMNAKSVEIAHLMLPLTSLERQAREQAVGYTAPMISPPSGNSLDSFNTSTTDSKMMDNNDIDNRGNDRISKSGIQYSRVDSGNFKNKNNIDDDDEPIIPHFNPLLDGHEIEYVHECLVDCVRKEEEEAERKLKEKEKHELLKKKNNQKHSYSHKKKHKNIHQNEENDKFAPPSPSSLRNRKEYLIPRKDEFIGWFDLKDGKWEPPTPSNTSGNSGPSSPFNGSSSEDPHKHNKRSMFGTSVASGLNDAEALCDVPELSHKLLLKIRVKRPPPIKKRKFLHPHQIPPTLNRRKSSSILEGPLLTQRGSSSSRLPSKPIDTSPRFNKHKSAGGVLNALGPLSPTTPPPPSSSSSTTTTTQSFPRTLPSQPQSQSQPRPIKPPNSSPGCRMNGSSTNSSVSPSPGRSRSANVITQRKLQAQNAANNKPSPQSNQQNKNLPPSNKRRISKNEDIGDGVALTKL